MWRVSKKGLAEGCKFGVPLGDAENPTGNHVQGKTRASGGAIDVMKSKIKLVGCRFEKNTCETAYPNNLPTGGDGSNPISWRPDFMNYGGAVALHHGGEIECSQGTFVSNEAIEGCGGAIAFVGQSEAATGEVCSYFDSTVQDVVIKNCKFELNKSVLHGAAVDGASLRSRCRIYSSSFGGTGKGNSAGSGVPSIDMDGGAVSYQSSYRAIRIHSASFRANTAFDGAGALKLGGAANAFIFSSSFIENTAGGNGGAIRCSTYAEASCRNVSFRGNSATGTSHVDLDGSSPGNGGALSLNLSDAICRNCVLSGNRSVLVGGGIHFESKPSGFIIVDQPGRFDTAKLTCESTTIRENQAKNAGGIGASILNGTNGGAATMDGLITLKSCQILRNTAAQRYSFTPAVDSASRPAFRGPLFSVPVDGILLVNRTKRKLSFVMKGTNGAPSRLSRHNGLAIYASNWTRKYSRLSLSLKNASFQSNGYGVVCRYSSLNINKCQFAPSRSVSRPIDIAVLDGETRAPSSGLNGQPVSITDSHFASHATAIGVAVAKARGGNLTPINVQIKGCTFLGRTVVNAPPAAVEPNGAVIVVTISRNDVDAMGNYWNSGGGPNSPSNSNLFGSYASRLVDHSNWLRQRPRQ